MALVEPERNFTQVQREKLFGHAAVVVEPMFGIAPKAFDSVQVAASLGMSLFLADNDVFSANRQRSIDLPIVGVVEAPSG